MKLEKWGLAACFSPEFEFTPSSLVWKWAFDDSEVRYLNKSRLEASFLLNFDLKLPNSSNLSLETLIVAFSIILSHIHLSKFIFSSFYFSFSFLVLDNSSCSRSCIDTNYSIFHIHPRTYINLLFYCPNFSLEALCLLSFNLILQIHQI